MGSIRALLGLVLASIPSPGQQYFISDLRGRRRAAPSGRSCGRCVISFAQKALVADPAGNVYFVSDNSVFKLNADGIVIRVAGSPAGRLLRRWWAGYERPTQWPRRCGGRGDGQLCLLRTRVIVASGKCSQTVLS